MRLNRCILFMLIFGEILEIITPLTLVVGIINAIKKTDKQEVILYTVMAIISAYLIVFAILLG